MDRKPLYRHTNTALLRAAAEPLDEATTPWPDLGHVERCRSWLDSVWSDSRLADAVRLASPSLSSAVDAIRAGVAMPDRRVRSATVSTMRYLLRRTGRPTPFGMFAGVVLAELGERTRVRWGDCHRVVARVSSEWLADVIERVENCVEALDRLDVVLTDLAVRRGGRLELPDGPNRVTIRYTRVVAAIADLAATPIRFASLVDALSDMFDAEPAKVLPTLTELVRCRNLLSSLRAPFTVTDPFTHVLRELRRIEADAMPELADLMRELAAVHGELQRCNEAPEDPHRSGDERARLVDRMRHLSTAGRTPLAVDLLLDCDIRLPHRIAHEIERAASVLLRLTRHPRGETPWHDYHDAFIDRYGTGTLVPLVDVLDPDGGLGYPATYPGRVRPSPAAVVSERDSRLLSLAWQALATGTREIVLTDEDVASLTDETFDDSYIPPHVELAARIHARSTKALDAGDFRITIAPARSAGTLTSRFTPMATGSGLAEVYREVPVATEGALRAQLSFGPLYAHAENVCRVPAYLDHVLPLGEHRAPADDHVAVADLAVMATRDRLHLVSMSRRQVVEPHVFHALALDKQPPPVARFLAQLPRAFSAAWYQFDWGPHAELPFLPQVRYRRTILFPAQWRLAPHDLPDDPARGLDALDRWRERWDCPEVVELRDADRTLRLNLSEPAHATLLRSHLARHDQVILTAAAPAEDYGWINGHVHEVAFPLVRTNAGAPSPLRGHLPTVTNGHGQHPASPDGRWLSAKLFTHPERMTEIVTARLPRLLAALDGHSCWWLRYRSSRELDHVRLRVRADSGGHGACADAIGQWVQGMRQDGIVGRLALDTYWPEIGRYGDGPALDAVEDVFVADSATVAAMLRHLPFVDAELVPLVVANMVGIVFGFFGDPGDGMEWLASRGVASAPAVDREIADRAVQLAVEPAALSGIPGWADDVDPAWQSRADALIAYRKTLPPEVDLDAVLESLLHMHHNRAVGIDPDHERACRRLARQSARAWRARRSGDRV